MFKCEGPYDQGCNHPEHHHLARVVHNDSTKLESLVLCEFCVGELASAIVLDGDVADVATYTISITPLTPSA